MKRLGILIFLLSITGLTYGQGEPSMTFTTTLDEGSNITMSFNADGADRPGIWIDWNHNKVRDEGEGVSPKQWGHWSQRQSYTLKSQTVTIYGKVKQFGAGGDKITAIDVTNNTNLTFLWLQSNQIKTLDLTGQTAIFHLQVNDNQLEGILDVSNLPLLQQLNVDRNNLEGLKMGTHPDLFQVNFSRNHFSEEAVEHVINAIPAVPGKNKAEGNFYCIDTRSSWSQFPEGTQLKQYHLDNPVFQGKWFTRDVNGGAKFNNISRVTDRYKMAFSTVKEAGSKISLNIDAEMADRSTIWVDLNGNEMKDAGEEVNNFGTDVSYSISSQDITVHGPVTKISLSGNELTRFDFLQNPFLNTVSSIDLSDNELTELNLTIKYLVLESLNIAGNRLSTDEISEVINALNDRSSTTPGTLTLLNLEGEEANGATNAQIALANAKNYIVKDGFGNTLLAGDIPLQDQTASELEDIEAYQYKEVLLPEKTDQGLEITYSIQEGKVAIAKVEGNKVTILRHGDLEITATQDGNANYKPFTKIITITILPAADAFAWLKAPAISVIGEYVTLVGPEEALAQFTKLYINGKVVEMEKDLTYDLTDYTGTIEVKATSDDGAYMMRVIVEK